MRVEDTTVQRSTAAMGAAMFISWLLFLGPVGLVLLLGIPYSMMVQDLAFGIVCGLLLAIPLVLTAVWIPVAFFGVVGKKRARSTAPASDAVPETVSAD